MSMNDIARFINFFEHLYLAVKHNDGNKSISILKEFSDFNQELYKFSNEFNMEYTKALTIKISYFLSTFKNQQIQTDKFKLEIKHWVDVLNKIEPQQVIFKKLVKHFVDHIMKESGFKKKGNRYIKLDRYSKELWIQLSSCNNYEDVQFTINLYINEGKKEIKSTRLNFVKGEKDNWYVLNPTVDFKKLGHMVNHDIITYAIPFFDSYQ